MLTPLRENVVLCIWLAHGKVEHGKSDAARWHVEFFFNSFESQLVLYSEYKIWFCTCRCSKYSYLAPAIEIKVYRKSFLLSHAHMNVQHFTSCFLFPFLIRQLCVVSHFAILECVFCVCVCATSSFDQIGWNKTKYNLIKRIPSTHSHGNMYVLCIVHTMYIVHCTVVQHLN